jgi:glycosyltransferase involved in cell wall biosynthesis
MKIAQIVCTFPPYPGGIGNVAYYNSLELAKMGHEVVVFTPRQHLRTVSDKIKSEEDKFKVKWLWPIFRYGNAAFLPQLFWQLKNFDIIHLHYPFFGGAKIVWLLKLVRPQIKLVITYHMDVVGKGILGWFFRFNNKFIMPRIIRSADKVIVTSFDYAENSNIASLIRKNKNKFVEISCGVDIDYFKPEEKEGGLLNKYNLNKEDKIILFLGNLDRAHYFKGVDYLLKAFSLLQKRLGIEQIKKEQGGKIRLLIVGSGDLLPVYKKLASDLGIANKVIFTGFIPNEELARHYNLADIFVLPSIDKSEAFGLVLLEAASSGKPVIASNLPGVRSVVKEGENGLLFQPKNEGDLASRISYLLSNEELRKKMGEAGRKMVEESYSWERIGKKLEEVYKLF